MYREVILTEKWEPGNDSFIDYLYDLKLMPKISVGATNGPSNSYPYKVSYEVEISNEDLLAISIIFPHVAISYPKFPKEITTNVEKATGGFSYGKFN